jgi:hypothetical protein
MSSHLRNERHLLYNNVAYQTEKRWSQKFSNVGSFARYSLINLIAFGGALKSHQNPSSVLHMMVELTIRHLDLFGFSGGAIEGKTILTSTRRLQFLALSQNEHL